MDISHNPIRVLTKESFFGLRRLQDLTVQYLPNLTRFDADSLAQLGYLTNLRIQSWPSIERFKFRLGSVVSGIASLRRLSARILEPNGVLADQGTTFSVDYCMTYCSRAKEHIVLNRGPRSVLPSYLEDILQSIELARPRQINGAFGPKLKELELTGTELHTLTLDAFEGIEGHELMLVVRGTSLEELPANFIDMFANVAHLSLDLRDNRLRRLDMEVFYNETEAGPWQWTGTGILKGRRFSRCLGDIDIVPPMPMRHNHEIATRVGQPNYEVICPIRN